MILASLGVILASLVYTSTEPSQASLPLVPYPCSPAPAPAPDSAAASDPTRCDPLRRGVGDSLSRDALSSLQLIRHPSGSFPPLFLPLSLSASPQAVGRHRVRRRDPWTGRSTSAASPGAPETSCRFVRSTPSRSLSEPRLGEQLSPLRRSRGRVATMMDITNFEFFTGRFVVVEIKLNILDGKSV